MGALTWLCVWPDVTFPSILVHVHVLDLLGRKLFLLVRLLLLLLLHLRADGTRQAILVVFELREQGATTPAAVLGFGPQGLRRSRVGDVLVSDGSWRMLLPGGRRPTAADRRRRAGNDRVAGRPGAELLAGPGRVMAGRVPRVDAKRAIDLTCGPILVLLIALHPRILAALGVRAVLLARDRARRLRFVDVVGDDDGDRLRRLRRGRDHPLAVRRGGCGRLTQGPRAQLFARPRVVLPADALPLARRPPLVLPVALHAGVVAAPGLLAILV
mmetsp:Transcript_102822/g.296067  ORF Transcript_102822/g.296067 Transcript_102822/m.296067 type:complete len:271 (+) Transcript_102822:551-1363(+)